MKFKPGIIKYTEPIMLIGLWLAVLGAPILFMQSNGNLQWDRVLIAWELVLPFFILFLINHFILVPLLLFKGSSVSFLISAIILIGVFSTGIHLYDKNRKHDQQRTLNQFEPPRERPVINHLPPDRPPGPDRPKGNPFALPPIVNTIILCILVIGFDTGLRMVVRWSILEREKNILEKENIRNQLAFLRNQVSPHFLMNTLNNIHILIDIDSNEAKDAVIQLSRLMRHLLYESADEKVPLKKELDFISSYFDLMRLRFSEEVIITMDIPEIIPEKSIPPLLFTSFVENAFKHGISYEGKSFINIVFEFRNDVLTFEITNSITDNKSNHESSGIGMENSIKRLKLLYSENYKLDISDNGKEHKLKLSLPL